MILSAGRWRRRDVPRKRHLQNNHGIHIRRQKPMIILIECLCSTSFHAAQPRTTASDASDAINETGIPAMMKLDSAAMAVFMAFSVIRMRISSVATWRHIVDGS